MRYCVSCGAAAGPGLRFCISCGASLPAGGEPPAAAAGRDSVFAHPAPPAAWPAPEVPPAPADSVFSGPPTPAPWAATPGPAPWSGDAAQPPADGFWDDGHGEDEGARRTLVVAGVVVAALLAVGGGYVVADRTLGGDASTASQSDDADRPSGSDPAGGSDPGDEDDEPAPTGGAAPPAGDDPLRPRSVTASCQAPPGVDAANVPVTYDPAHTLDGVGSTAWRCPGSAVGQQLVFDFGRPVTVASVGLVPGYDKVDPVDGTDRFGENRTVTGVTWRFDDGTTHRQEIAAPTRALARTELDEPATTTRVVLEITRTGNDAAVRDFTTISDVAFVGSD
ncbi:discoidin domain-containing protein [Candidatus Blastococcus massiliensis]|uniref:discoidin domain-containing protein n=1 Tax=Candidatus Blastococcus massiliensis TaxID=1470358 RepID=UPI0004BA8292|nr:discoidin domain-containing protein [Candidatus Blastococcus massiliensis]